MNTHPSPSPSNAAPSGVLVSALRMIEQAGPRMVRLGLVWAVAAVVAFAVSGSVSESFRAPFEFAKWLSAIVSIQFFGRWIHNQRMRHWLAYQIEAASGGPVWDEIPGPSQRLSVRAFSSLADASGPDWTVGEIRARAEGQDIPEWVAYKGERFDFAGRAPKAGRSLAENERLFGTLLYVKHRSPAPVALTQETPAK